MFYKHALMSYEPKEVHPPQVLLAELLELDSQKEIGLEHIEGE